MRRLILTIVGMSFLTSVVAAGERHVVVEGNTVTIEARDVTVESLLTAITQRSGLQIDLEAPLTERVTVRMEQIPLTEALHHILHGQNFAVRHTDSGRDADPDAARKLWVFARSDGVRAPSVGAVAARERQRTVVLSRPPIAAAPRVDAKAQHHARRQNIADLIDAGTEQAVDALAELALSDADASIRAEAVYGLGEVGGDRSRQILQQALNDLDSGVREAAIQTVAEMGGEDAAWALASALNDTDAALREDVVYALGEIGGETVLPILKRALADDQSAVREAAADVLDELSNSGP